MKRRAWLVLVGIVLLVVAVISVVQVEPLAAVDAADREPVTVEGDRLEVDMKTGRALLVGGVRMRRGKLELACGQLEALYDVASTVKWVKATDGVVAKYDLFDAKASEAEFDLERNHLTLRGDVVVRRNGAWIMAREVSVDLRTRRLTMEHVRGSIPVSSSLVSSLNAVVSSASVGSLPVSLPVSSTVSLPVSLPVSSTVSSTVSLPVSSTVSLPVSSDGVVGSR